MQSGVHVRLSSLLAIGLSAGSGLAQDNILRVVAVGSEPFVVAGETGAPPSGFSVDVWSALADSIGAETELTVAEEVPEALAMVAAGDADVAIGPISITAMRAREVRFIQPYFHSSLGILAPAAGSLLDRFAPFLTSAFLIGASALAAVLLLVGMLFWLAERRGNPEHFPAVGLAGIGNGLWLALVTMTTVGYGDRVPLSGLGRVLAGVWMLVSLVIASSLTAFLATALTLSQMAGPSIETSAELGGRDVGVVAGTTSEQFVLDSRARPVAAADIAEAVDQLLAGETDAVVFDRPILRYALSQRPDTALALSPLSYRPQNYGFAVAFGSPLAPDLDVALLALQEAGGLEGIEERWLGAE
jgi:polar amino acid transport system substrate-binding protein